MGKKIKIISDLERQMLDLELKMYRYGLFCPQAEGSASEQKNGAINPFGIKTTGEFQNRLENLMKEFNIERVSYDLYLRTFTYALA